MMGWYGGGTNVGAWLFLGLFWVALLALILWRLVRLLPPGADAQSPEEILGRRFRRGELDEQTLAAQRAAPATSREPRR